MEKENPEQINTFVNRILKHDFRKNEEKSQERIPSNFGTDIQKYQKIFCSLIKAECIASLSNQLKVVNQNKNKIAFWVIDQKTSTDHSSILTLLSLKKEEEKILKNMSSQYQLGLLCSKQRYQPEYYGLSFETNHFAFLCQIIKIQSGDKQSLTFSAKAFVSEADFALKMSEMETKEVYFFCFENNIRQSVIQDTRSWLRSFWIPHFAQRQQQVIAQHQNNLENIMSFLKQKFNQSQFQSIRQMVMRQKGLVLLQGPPGTGKTSTIMGLLSAQYSSLRYRNESKKILICAPSNSAVDHIVKRIKAEGLFDGKGKIIKPEILRVGVVETDDPDVRSVSLLALCEKQVQLERESAQIRNIAQLEQKIIQLQKKLRNAKNKPEEEDLKKKLQRYEEMMDSFQSEKVVFNRNTYNAIENKLLQKAEIILTTLTSSGSEKIDAIRGEFACLIVDQAAQATEPNLLIALQTGVQKVLLIGDPYQLPVTCMSQDSNVTLFNRSLFQRFIDAKVRPYLLDTQYRMHPRISAFPSLRFYDSRLKDAENLSSRAMPYILTYFKNRNVMFIDITYGKQNKREDSYENISEAKTLAIYAKYLFHSDITIGVITPYKSQNRTIYQECKHNMDAKQLIQIKINTIDSYQGEQKDVILISTVRADKKDGFFWDSRKINVALTRAKHLLVIVGHGKTLRTNQYWNQLLTMLENDNLYYQSKYEGQTQEVVGISFNFPSRRKVQSLPKKRQKSFLKNDLPLIQMPKKKRILDKK